MSNNPTEQQLYCVKLCTTENKVKISAAAGSGKTSTLILIADSLKVPSVYLAFNKSIATEASSKFPKHVTCRTTHSLAYGAFGVPLQSKLTRPRGHYVNVAGTGSEIAKYYHLDPVVDASGEYAATANAMGLFIRTTVERFEQSADMQIGKWHVPKRDMEKVLAADKSAEGYVLKMAKKLWQDRINVNSNVLATHDTYLKLYQMSKPVLPFDIVYVDEFQDTTPCVMDIVNNQKDTAKIVAVGDSFQAIYSFRGAINAMALMTCQEAPLSMSFRFGQGIADVATAVLGNKMVIQGRPDLKSVIGYDVVDKAKPYMYLFRTNAMLLTEAVAAIDRGEQVKVAIDVKDFVKLLQSAVALHANDHKKVKHERILPYPSWSVLAVEGKATGGELKRVLEIVEGRRANHIINVLENYSVPPKYMAHYTTCHKAKGLEAMQVILADDFPTNYKKDGTWVGLIESEENLLYVALTRSQHTLEINKTVAEILERAKMNFYEPEEDYVEHEQTTHVKMEKEFAFTPYMDSPKRKKAA
jgi:hypothetical protein